MIPKLLSSGQSFAGLSNYLTHDPKAQTANRVAWTYTLNCTDDHLPSAINDMVWTYRNAGILKEEAGIEAGGRPLKKPVKHFSLNWSPEEEVTREQMIAASEDFLKFMGWQEHQAVLVAHSDKEHQHVHVMLNSVHPETGLKLDDSFERRRAQEWALEYERANGHIFCEQRLKNIAEREPALTRDAWLAFQQAEKANANDNEIQRQFDPNYMGKLENRTTINAEEWALLKGFQKDERQAFVAEGKAQFKELRNSVYREVREEFRERWADYYTATRAGADADELKEIRAELIAEQKSTLAARRDEACRELREQRSAAYRELRDEQKEARHELHSRQEQGTSSPHLLNLVNAEPAMRLAVAADTEPAREPSAAALDRPSADETVSTDTVSRPVSEREEEVDEPFGRPAANSSGLRSGPDIATGLTFGMIGGFASIGESLFDGFFGGAPAPKRAVEDKPRPAPFKEEPDRRSAPR